MKTCHPKRIAPIARRWGLLFFVGAVLFSGGEATLATERQAVLAMVENRTPETLQFAIQGNGVVEKRVESVPPGVRRVFRVHSPARRPGIWLHQQVGSWTTRSLLENGMHYVIERPGSVRVLGQMGN